MRLKLECDCGSGLIPDPEYDARDIYLCLACDSCRKKKLSRYRTAVLTDSDYECDEPIYSEDELY